MQGLLLQFVDIMYDICTIVPNVNTKWVSSPRTVVQKILPYQAENISKSG